MNDLRQRVQMRRGYVAILVLAILTVLEFIAAVTMSIGLFAALAFIAIVKTWIILDYFMHITNLWHSDDEGH